MQRIEYLILKTILDYAEEALEWPTLVEEANAMTKKAEDICAEHGTASDNQKLPVHKKEIQKGNRRKGFRSAKKTNCTNG
jgi:hypothetical protein